MGKTRSDLAGVVLLRVLNAYAGLGGNRKHWTGCEVTAIENDPKIAAEYQRQHPGDTVIIADAHEYLRDNAAAFDFVWSSPPCQSHSRMIRGGRNRRPRYPDLSLYAEILYLKHCYKGAWLVENVIPYYTPLIPAQRVGRHLFWSSLDLADVVDIKRPPGFIHPEKAGGAVLKDWLGIHYEKNIYYAGNHCPVQVLRNCVHPDLGSQIFNKVKQ